MRKFILASIALLTFTSPALALQDLATPVAPCDITVSFGSAGTGPDRDTTMSMKTYLDGDKARLKYTRHNRGQEGEYNYCIMINDSSDSRSIYRNLKSMLPIDQAGGSPVMIKARHSQVKQVNPVVAVPPIVDEL